MSEIIDFFKAKEKYGKKNKDSEPTAEPVANKGSKLISYSAIETEKIKAEHLTLQNIAKNTELF